jgi:hypothetical protein
MKEIFQNHDRVMPDLDIIAWRATIFKRLVREWVVVTFSVGFWLRRVLAPFGLRTRQGR